MKKIVGGKVYNTETAKIVAHNNFWDGNNWERNGTNCFLYKTKKGNFFTLDLTMWQGERDNIKPLSKKSNLL